jgi:RNA polymerase sigma-70 factor (ECF subfamily)
MHDARRDAAARATLAARESYGKLLAVLASRMRTHQPAVGRRSS